MKKIIFHYFSGSPLIKIRFGTPVTHVGVEFDDGMYFESDTFKGNIKMARRELKRKPVYSVTIEVENDKYYKARLAANNIYGRRYDYKALVGFILGIKMQNDNDFFCSELGRQVFEAATGKKLKLARLTTPYDLYLMTATHAAP
ncbi:enoyl-CoA hydratase/carnithine racemase-like protein [Vibrio phage vB_VpaM_sm033]|nr:enoyl-CoA hydratase/carnithine racemase-like protein [Vibrio phage vB_VpaM_sm033]